MSDEKTEATKGSESVVERVVMREIRDEFTANAEHFDGTMMKMITQIERLIEKNEQLENKLRALK